MRDSSEDPHNLLLKLQSGLLSPRGLPHRAQPPAGKPTVQTSNQLQSLEKARPSFCHAPYSNTPGAGPAAAGHVTQLEVFISSHTEKGKWKVQGVLPKGQGEWRCCYHIPETDIPKATELRAWQAPKADLNVFKFPPEQPPPQGFQESALQPGLTPQTPSCTSRGISLCLQPHATLLLLLQRIPQQSQHSKHTLIERFKLHRKFLEC